MAPGRTPAIFAAATILLALVVGSAEGRLWDPLRMATDRFVTSPASAASAGEEEGDVFAGTKWAVLIAGSRGYYNYRHQADVCHAYQIMKEGGLKDENIIVFMYDDIADNFQNPRKGTIINHPQGADVYHGVPKDYTGRDVTVNNFLAVLLGNATALTGGSGKVLTSGPDDHVFIYFSDHGGPGILGMPTSPYLYGNDLVDVLKKKHASGSYNSMVFYLEACESGSIFEGLLPEDINIYATTAANAEESSWATYCPGDSPDFPKEYSTCLGDLYSVAWMEDSETYNLRTESLKQQYGRVKDRTSVDGTYYSGSHVMQYGNVDMNVQHLVLYMGSNPENENHTFSQDNSLPSFSRAANQRDADLLHFWNKLMKSPESSLERTAAQKELLDVVAHRLHVDNSVELIGKVLFGSERATQILKAVRPSGRPLVDDWDCLKTMVRTFEAHCGSLSQYGMKHMRSLANICNAGVKKETMAEAASQACLTFPSNPWSSISNGFSA